jgi:hypothetical protein
MRILANSQAPGQLQDLQRSGNVLQRSCGCDRAKRKRLSRQAAANSKRSAAVPPAVAEVLRSPGRPLDAAARRFMESRFGRDFSRVRVHTDAKAAASARAVDALAYTVGTNVVFDAGRYAPGTPAGRKLLAHELAHVVQQEGAGRIDLQSLTIGPADDLYERQASRAGEAVSGPFMPAVAPASSPAALQRQTAGVCGPRVDSQVNAIWSKIKTDFKSWTPDQRDQACVRVLVPVQMPTRLDPHDPMGTLRSAADINGWDVLPLFQGASLWLRSHPIYDSSTGGPCATPSSSNPGGGPYDDAHEDPRTCSNTVEIGGKCWLNGTVNYGTYGIMVRLCHDEFPIKFAFALTVAETLIRAYKKLGSHPEDSSVPISWVRAAYNGGPSGRPAGPGNRPGCQPSCSLDGGVVSWDYVWEPVKPRASATSPFPPPPPIPTLKPPGPAPVVLPPGAKSYIVQPGDSLSKIAAKFYGNPMLWPRIYQANMAEVGPNPNRINPKQKLIIP